MNRNLSVKVLLALAGLGLFFSIVLWNILSLKELGANLPVGDLVQDYVIGLIYAGLVAVAIISLPIRDRGQLLVVWLLRVCVVCLFLPIYEGHYDILDAYTYYHYGVLREIPIGYEDSWVGTILIYRFNTVLCAAAADSYRAMTVIYSGIGLCGGVLFYRAFTRISGRDNIRMFYLINVMPSVLLWTSPISKDSLTFLALGASLYFFSRFSKEGRRKHLASLIVCMLAAGLIRPWWSGILGAALFFAAVWLRELPHRALSLIVVGLAVMGSVGLIMFNGIDTVDIALNTVDVSMRASSLGGSAQDVPEMRGVVDALLFFPKGAATVLLRPFPWEAHNLFAFLASLENIWVFILLVVAVKHVWRQGRREPLVAWGLGFLVAWLMIYSFFAYQNLGTSVRYRAPLLPVLLVLAGGGVTWLRAAATPHSKPPAVRDLPLTEKDSLPPVLNSVSPSTPHASE